MLQSQVKHASKEFYFREGAGREKPSSAPPTPDLELSHARLCEQDFPPEINWADPRKETSGWNPSLHRQPGVEFSFPPPSPFPPREESRSCHFASNTSKQQPTFSLKREAPELPLAISPGWLHLGSHLKISLLPRIRARQTCEGEIKAGRPFFPNASADTLPAAGARPSSGA